MSKRVLIGFVAVLLVAGAVMVVFEPWEKEPAGAATGMFDRTWGMDVDAVAPGNGFEICTVAGNCKIGAGTTGLGGELDDPLGVATDSRGDVYVADGTNLRVEKFDAAGNFLRAWGKDIDAGGDGGWEVCTVPSACHLDGTGGLGGEFSSPAGIAVDGADNVYVSDLLPLPPGAGTTSRIQKFDSSGNFQLAWGRDVVQEGKPGDTDLNGFEICTDRSFCQEGGSGTLGGEMYQPAGLGADAAGNVYVADQLNNRIQKFSSSGAFLAAWGNDVVQDGKPGDVGPAGFEICTTAADCKAGVLGSAGGALNAPGGVAADDAGNVYVADGLGSRIQKFGDTGGWQRAWGMGVDNAAPGDGFEICTVAANCRGGGHGGFGGEMVSPSGVAADAGSVYVGDTGNHRIQRFDSSGNFQRAWGKDVVQGGAVGFEVCTSAGACKAGVVGARGGEMDDPTGLWSAGSRLYIADEHNHRVQTFTDFPPPGGTAAPSNAFSVEKLKGKVLTLSVSSAGTVEVTDAGAAAAGERAAAAAKRMLKTSTATGGPGAIAVTLKLTKAAKEKLRRKGRVRANARITFTPNGGTAASQTTRLKIKRK